MLGLIIAILREAITDLIVHRPRAQEAALKFKPHLYLPHAEQCVYCWRKKSAFF